MMCTPNGRFAPNTKLCLSMTDFHPEVSRPCPLCMLPCMGRCVSERWATGLGSGLTSLLIMPVQSWNPMWACSSILQGLASFMYENGTTTGSISSSRAEKQRRAAESLDYNLKNPTFRKLFPDWVEEAERRKQLAEASHITCGCLCSCYACLGMRSFPALPKSACMHI